MKDIERIRDRILLGQKAELTRLRVYLSQTDGNREAVDRLRNDPDGPTKDERESLNLIMARVTQVILESLGHATKTSVEESHSRVRRAVNRVR